MFIFIEKSNRTQKEKSYRRTKGPHFDVQGYPCTLQYKETRKAVLLKSHVPGEDNNYFCPRSYLTLFKKHIPST